MCGAVLLGDGRKMISLTSLPREVFYLPSDRNSDRCLVMRADDPENKEALALSFCVRCPVVEACLKASEGEQYGVWGGVVRGWPEDD